MMRTWILVFLSTLLVCARPGRAADSPSVIAAVGAGGTDEYSATFLRWVLDWQRAAEAGKAQWKLIGARSEDTDAVRKLQDALAAEPKEGTEPLWLVLIGHGTATAGDAKFNLRGNDVPATQLVEWLKPFQRPLVVVCAFSTSGAWMKPLAARGRVVVTATRSASEVNFSRFGGFLAAAMVKPEADLDQDGQTSLLEAYLAASRETAAWYAQEGRLATEHPLLDDNGDGAGTPAEWFSGVRAVKKPRQGEADGTRAHQFHLVRSKEEQALSPEARQRRGELEAQLAALRDQKATMPEADYLRDLEKILLELAKVYHTPERERVRGN